MKNKMIRGALEVRSDRMFNLIDIWHLTFDIDIWFLTFDIWHMTYDIWHSTNVPKDRWTNGPMDQWANWLWTNGPIFSMDQWTNGQMDQWTSACNCISHWNLYNGLFHTQIFKNSRYKLRKNPNDKLGCKESEIHPSVLSLLSGQSMNIYCPSQWA